MQKPRKKLVIIGKCWNQFAAARESPASNAASKDPAFVRTAEVRIQKMTNDNYVNNKHGFWPDPNDAVKWYENRVQVLESALRGFLTQGTSIGASHPHLAPYIAFPDKVWEDAKKAMEISK